MNAEERKKALAKHLNDLHYDGTGCGTDGSSGCSNCFGPSPMSAYEIAEALLEWVDEQNTKSQDNDLTDRARAEAECPFCAIAAGTAPATVLQEWPDALVIVPLGPVTEGHVLVIPREHVADFSKSPEVTASVMRRAAEYAGRADRAGRAVNLITSRGADATQTVFHLHVHLVPRVAGDGLSLPWAAEQDTDLRAEVTRLTAVAAESAALAKSLVRRLRTAWVRAEAAERREADRTAHDAPLAGSGEQPAGVACGDCMADPGGCDTHGENYRAAPVVLAIAPPGFLGPDDLSQPAPVVTDSPDLAVEQDRAVRAWWEAYSVSIRNRRGNHPTTQQEAERARDEAFRAVLAAVRAEALGLWVQSVTINERGTWVEISYDGAPMVRGWLHPVPQTDENKGET